MLDVYMGDCDVDRPMGLHKPRNKHLSNMDVVFDSVMVLIRNPC